MDALCCLNSANAVAVECTFIVVLKKSKRGERLDEGVARDVSGHSSFDRNEEEDKKQEEEGRCGDMNGKKEGEEDEKSRMIGDVNLFFNEWEEEEGVAEIEVMIAEKECRRCGAGREAVEMMMAYGMQELVWLFVWISQLIPRLILRLLLNTVVVRRRM